MDATSAAVLFDFGGTLDADGLSWKERVYRLFVDEGVAVARARFDPVFHAADDALVGAVPPALSLRETVERLVAGVAGALELADPTVAGRVARRFLDATLESLRDNTPLLARLARRYRLAIVSNFYGNLERVCDETGIRPLFAAIVDSARVGCAKPDPRIFRHALDALGTTPAAATFVGDSLPRDMAGARALGMRHIWLVGDAAPAGGPCCRNDRVIHSLKDLEGVLL
ncbi:MAG: HAD family hydrolase [Candidatus Rokuibacteriota bacterium]